MKNTLLFLGIVFLFIGSCSKEITANNNIDNDPSEEIKASTEIVFNLNANLPEGTSTKAVKTGWETTDVIYVFFSGQQAPKYLQMKRWLGEWLISAKNSLSLSEGETGTMTAVFLPFGSSATVAADGTSFIFDKTYYTYYLTAQLPYTVSDGKVSGTFDMAIPEGYMQFFIDWDNNYTGEIALREPNLIPQGIASIAADGTITTTSLASGAPLPGYEYDKDVKQRSPGEKKGWLFSGILASERRNVATDYYFTLVWGNWKTGGYYTKSFTDKTFYRGDSDGRAVKLPLVKNWTRITDYKPIDLGCDVNGKRVYWSSRNIGAAADFPDTTTFAAMTTTFGNFFAWGETATKDDFSWSTYKYGSSSTELTKYCGDSSYGKDGFTDMLTELDASDDAASVNLGGIWRMPTDEEFTALRTGLTWSWDNDHRGYTVCASGGTAWTDPTIFLPAAGYKADGGAYFQKWTYGRYWSSSVVNTIPYVAYGLSFSLTTSYEQYSASRMFGYSVRPVTN